MVMIDMNTTTESSAYVRKITLDKDERHFVNVSSNCKNMPRTSFTYNNRQSGIIATVNHHFLNKYRNNLIDIAFKMAKDDLPAPSDRVVSSFINLKDLLSENGIEFKSFAPIEDGGLLLDFVSGFKYFSLEMYNDFTTSIYVENKDSGEPILMDDFDIALTNKVVAKYL